MRPATAVCLAASAACLLVCFCSPAAAVPAPRGASFLSGSGFSQHSLSTSVPTDVDELKFSTAGSPGFSMRSWKGTSKGKPYVAHLATLENPKFFSFELPIGGCGHRVKTSVTAAERNCAYATNGGFFDLSTGACVGNVVVNGTYDSVVGGTGSNFGLTKDSFITGYVSLEDLQSHKYPFHAMLQGKGWLVRLGKPHLAESIAHGEVSKSFVTEMAPRTAVGYTNNGTVLLLVVDGEEDIKAGANLYMMEDIMMGLGAYSAINLDGGGSSVAVYHGNWVSHPTCNDNPTPCERTVTSITCISDV